MIVVGQTITGAASGEDARIIATPKGSRSQAKGQKNNTYFYVI